MMPHVFVSMIRRASGAALLTVLLAPAAVYAQDSTMTAPLRACFVPGSGTVYRVGAAGTPRTCTRTEHVEFSFSSGTEATLAGGKQGGGNGGGGGSAVMVGDAASGDLAGSYPSPVVAGLQGQPVSPLKPSAGQALLFDGSAWMPAALPASGGASAHAQLTGLDADDHSQYLLADGARASTNGFAVTGSVGQGMAPASGTGTRLMWYPGKAAFRAGYAVNDAWDDAKTGVYSTALGLSSIASGEAAVALGWGNQATQKGSVALGTESQATGWQSTAVGYHTVASGLRSAAFGIEAKATGESAVALGRYSTAAGVNSIAFMGTATGTSAVAMGSGAQATGDHAMAFGWVTAAAGTNGLAAGYYTSASGNRSTALGNYVSTNNKVGAFVIGDASTGTYASAQADNQFVVRAQKFWFGSNNNVTATYGRFIETSTGAYLSTGGTWINSSDVNRKHFFQDVDTDAVLEKVAALPITTWSYKEDDASVRHMGPMAQDFRAAFGLGDGEKSIATVDADGVALAAIQALEQRTRMLQQENAELRAELDALKREVRELLPQR